jgi:hypothetical protein
MATPPSAKPARKNRKNFACKYNILGRYINDIASIKKFWRKIIFTEPLVAVGKSGIKVGNKRQISGKLNNKLNDFGRYKYVI